MLARVISRGEALDAPLAEGLSAIRPRDRSLLQALCYGTLRQYHRLEAILGQALDKPLKQRDADIHALLLCGLHQLLDMRIPDHASISASVEACRSLGKPWATGLVNGVLRRCSRESERMTARLADSERLAHPPWLLEALRRAWPDHWEAIIEANNRQPPMCIRVNRLRTDRDSYRDVLHQAGIEAQDCTLAADGLRLQAAVDVNELPGFFDGDVSIQDEAAQLAAPLLDPQPGERVLDACAAPGGKTCHLREYQPSLAELVAMDSDADRLARVGENLSRLGLDARLLCARAQELPATLEPESFDRILVDAPCSGSGVIRRHPDIKLLRRAGDIPAFAEQQLEILNGLWPLLRPGGRLLYVTCSVLPAENAECVARFLAATDSAEAELLAVDWGEEAGPGRQLLTRPGGADGMYYAAIRKRSQG